MASPTLLLAFVLASSSALVMPSMARGRAPSMNTATSTSKAPSTSTALTDSQINLIRSTWAGVEELGSEAVGVLLFTNIFKAAPQAAGLFPFGREPNFDPLGDLASNPALVKHGRGVVETVGAAVSLLDDLPTLGPVLVELGAKHIIYKVEPVHYPIVGGAFLETLKAGLADAYTDEVRQAYTAMWGLVEATMLSAELDAQYTPKAGNAGKVAGKGLERRFW